MICQLYDMYTKKIVKGPTENLNSDRWIQSPESWDRVWCF